MSKHIIGRLRDIPDNGRIIVNIQGRSVGVFRVNGRLYALLNRCPHMGASLCHGSVLGRVHADAPGELRYDDSRPVVQCPWHGWEYDLATGESCFDSRVRPYPVNVESGEAVLRDVGTGEAQSLGEDSSATAISGVSGASSHPGRLVAETYAVTVEEDYVVVTMPRRPTRNASTEARAPAGDVG